MSNQFEGLLLAEIPKNQREVYRVTRRNYKGHELVDLRIWYRNANTGDLLPGNKGITIKLELLPELLEVLGKIGDAHAQTIVCSHPA